MKLFTVAWSRALYNADDNTVDAWNGVHGIYSDETAAQAALRECLKFFIDGLSNEPDLTAEDRASLQHNLAVYGCETDGFFELDYEFDGCPFQIYMQIVTSELVC